MSFKLSLMIINLSIACLLPGSPKNGGIDILREEFRESGASNVRGQEAAQIVRSHDPSLLRGIAFGYGRIGHEIDIIGGILRPAVHLMGYDAVGGIVAAMTT